MSVPVVLSHYETIQTIARRMVQDMLLVVWWLVLMDHLLLCVIILPFLSTLLEKLVIIKSAHQQVCTVPMHTLHSVSPTLPLLFYLQNNIYFKIILFFSHYSLSTFPFPFSPSILFSLPIFLYRLHYCSL